MTSCKITMYFFDFQTMLLENAFDKLPDKARQIILKSCTRGDLKSLSCCSKSWNAICRPLLFNSLVIPWETMQRSDSTSDDILTSLEHTTSLTLYVDDDDLSLYYGNDDDGQSDGIYHAPRSLTWKAVGETFKTLVKHFNYNSLQTLHVQGFLQVPGVYVVCTCLPNIRNLSLTDIHTLPFMGWGLLFGLPCLERLSLSRCSLPNGALKFLNDSVSLMDVSFMEICALGDGILTDLSKLPNLTSVSLTRCMNISATGLRELCINTSSLRELTLIKIPVDNETLTTITNHATNLDKLVFQQCLPSKDNSSCFQFGKIDSLGELRLLGVDYLSQSTLENVSASRSLQNLQIEGCSNITDSSLDVFATSLPALTELSVGSCKFITSDGLQHLKGLPRLMCLNVGGCDLNDEALDVIGQLISLQSLDVSCTRNISNDGLSHLISLTRLTELNISNCRRITDGGLACVASLSNLLELDVSKFDHGSDPCISNRGLTHLSKLRKLKVLTISGSEDIKENGFLVLTKIKSLRELRCHGIQHLFSDHHIENFCRVSGMKEKAEVRPTTTDPVRLTANQRYWPRNGSCGLSWNCHCTGMHLLDLPFEIREKICTYLSLHQIKNFSLCSKMCRESVKHFLWSSVEIHWKSLEEPMDATTLECFGHVKTLCFVLDDDDHFYRHDDLGEYRCTGEIVEWQDVASTFR